jgi:hypothetical protein
VVAAAQRNTSSGVPIAADGEITLNEHGMRRPRENP